MLKIGDFSKLSQVTIKTLRYYDDLGLLKPVHVETFTGYRFYSLDQLPRLNRIIALKELGFSLDQIQQLLKEDVSAEQIKGMLLLKQSEIERQLQEDMERLARIKARLYQIEHEDQPTGYDIIVKPVPSTLIASIRATIPTYADVGMLFGALFPTLHHQAMLIQGSPLVIYHDGEYRETNPDIEAAVPIASISAAPAAQYPQPSSNYQVQCRELPAALVASTIHVGSYDTISTAYAAIMRWLEANHYQVDGANRETYLRGPGLHTTPEQYVTELQTPITKIDQTQAA